MLVYTIALALSVFICLIAYNKNRDGFFIKLRGDNICINKTIMVCMFAAFIPAVVSAVRYEVGTDYVNTYAVGYEKVMKNDDSHGFEIGYLILNKLVQLFGFDYYAIFIVTAFIFVMFTYAGIANVSDNIRMSIVLFFITRYYFIGMNCVRQLIALSILLYSMKYVIRRDFKHYIFVVLIALSFHYTSVLFIPIYFLYDFKITRKYKILMLIGFLMAGVVMKPVCMTLLKNTKYYRIFIKYGNAGIKFTIFTIVFNLLILYVFSLAKKKHNSDKKLNFFYNVQFIAAMMTFLLQSLPVIERLYWIYSFPVIATLPYGFKKIKNVYIRYTLEIALFSMYAFYFVYDIIMLKDHGVLPYKTIFQK